MGARITDKTTIHQPDLSDSGVTKLGTPDMSTLVPESRSRTPKVDSYSTKDSSSQTSPQNQTTTLQGGRFAQNASQASKVLTVSGVSTVREVNPREIPALDFLTAVTRMFLDHAKGVDGEMLASQASPQDLNNLMAIVGLAGGEAVLGTEADARFTDAARKLMS